MKAAILLLAAGLVLLAQARTSEEQVETYVDDVFYRYDGNEDLYLDRGEAKPFFADANGKKTVPEAEYAAWFRLIDVDRDLLLSWNEIYELAEAALED